MAIRRIYVSASPEHEAEMVEMARRALNPPTIKFNQVVVDRARFDRILAYAHIAATLLEADPHVEDGSEEWTDEHGYKHRGRITDIFDSAVSLEPGDLDPLPDHHE